MAAGCGRKRHKRSSSSCARPARRRAPPQTINNRETIRKQVRPAAHLFKPGGQCIEHRHLVSLLLQQGQQRLKAARRPQVLAAARPAVRCSGQAGRHKLSAGVSGRIGWVLLLWCGQASMLQCRASASITCSATWESKARFHSSPAHQRRTAVTPPARGWQPMPPLPPRRPAV